MGLPQNDALVIVTGGSGRVGRLLVNYLRERGCRVVSLSRSHSSSAHADDVRVDLADPVATREAMANFPGASLVHLASVLHGDCLFDANKAIDDSVASAIRHVQFASIVLASSSSVYGTESASAHSELSPLEGKSPYARSKVYAERAFRAAVESLRPPPSLTILRIFNVAGPEFPESLVQRLIRADVSEPVIVTGADTFVRDYLHQDDLIRILAIATFCRFNEATVVNVGSGVSVSSRWLLDTLEVAPGAYVEVDGAPSISRTEIATMIRLFGIVPRTYPDRSWDEVEAS